MARLVLHLASTDGQRRQIWVHELPDCWQVRAEWGVGAAGGFRTERFSRGSAGEASAMRWVEQLTSAVGGGWSDMTDRG